MFKKNKILILQEKVNDIEKLKNAGFSQQFKLWYNNTCNDIKNIFIDSPNKIEEFKSIPFESAVQPIVFNDTVIVPSDEVKIEMFNEGLDKAKIFLESAIYELEQYHVGPCSRFFKGVLTYLKEFFSPRTILVLVSVIIASAALYLMIKNDDSAAKNQNIEQQNIEKTDVEKKTESIANEGGKFTIVNGSCPVDENPDFLSDEESQRIIDEFVRWNSDSSSKSPSEVALEKWAKNEKKASQKDLN